MTHYIARRLAYSLLSLFLLSLTIFLFVRDASRPQAHAALPPVALILEDPRRAAVDRRLQIEVAAVAEPPLAPIAQNAAHEVG